MDGSFNGTKAVRLEKWKEQLLMVKAKRWLHDKVRGTERTGVLVTKEAARLAAKLAKVTYDIDDK